MISTRALVAVVAVFTTGLSGCGAERDRGAMEAASSQAASSDVVDFQLMTPDDGWALTVEALTVTDDGGETWRDATPPAAPADAIADTFFLEPDRGWTLVTEDLTQDQEDVPGWTLFATKDGGTTWIPSPFPGRESYGRGAPVFVDFVDESRGWVMVKEPSSAQFSLGTLFRTTDAGATWEELEVPIGGEINFIDRSTGWTAGGPRGDELYVTRDAGATWQRVSVALPPAFKGATPVYGVPSVATDDVAVLPVTFAGRRAVAGFAFYRSTDGGSTWSLPGPVVPSPKTVALGVTTPADAATAETWFAIDPQRAREIFVARDRGQRVEQSQAEGVPQGVFSLDFASETTGWAASATETCPQKANCVHRSTLLETESGGESWHALSPP